MTQIYLFVIYAKMKTEYIKILFNFKVPEFYRGTLNENGERFDKYEKAELH
jgi:hypothetical protein